MNKIRKASGGDRQEEWFGVLRTQLCLMGNWKNESGFYTESFCFLFLSNTLLFVCCYQLTEDTNQDDSLFLLIEGNFSSKFIENIPKLRNKGPLSVC